MAADSMKVQTLCLTAVQIWKGAQMTPEQAVKIAFQIYDAVEVTVVKSTKIQE